jgi:hypothetical protein
MALHFDNPCSEYPAVQDAEVSFYTEEHQTLRKTAISLYAKMYICLWKKSQTNYTRNMYRRISKLYIKPSLCTQSKFLLHLAESFNNRPTNVH